MYIYSDCTPWARGPHGSFEVFRLLLRAWIKGLLCDFWCCLWDLYKIQGYIKQLIVCSIYSSWELISMRARQNIHLYTQWQPAVMHSLAVGITRPTPLISISVSCVRPTAASLFVFSWSFLVCHSTKFDGQGTSHTGIVMLDSCTSLCLRLELPRNRGFHRR